MTHDAAHNSQLITHNISRNGSDWALGCGCGCVLCDVCVCAAGGLLVESLAESREQRGDAGRQNPAMLRRRALLACPGACLPAREAMYGLSPPPRPHPPSPLTTPPPPPRLATCHVPPRVHPLLCQVLWGGGGASW
jgi:hypothetical protein